MKKIGHCSRHPYNITCTLCKNDKPTLFYQHLCNFYCKACKYKVEKAILIANNISNL